MLSNRIWVDSGKPRSGSVFDSRTHDKFCYKSLIEKRKYQDKESMSNDLHESLLQKNSCAFWKTWKSKVCRSKQSIPCVDGSNDESIVTEKFREYFQNICTVNSAEHDAHITDKFNSRLSDFSKSKSDQMHWAESDYTISVELVDFAMNELHAGKAAGLDQLQTEHLINSHPILYKILSLLFNLILQLGVVPSEFGQGLLIPIPKDSGARGILKVSQFRGITISPVISKVFEHCILKLFKTYLYSSDRQFGFKKKIGCNHAIFAVRKTIDYFVENGSTVNMCCLDVASAFDRVNYRGLFLKLLDRGVPMNLINVLNDWYCKSECMVKWGNCISKAFPLTAGVRQGGVLSPILFSVYVDNILRNLNNLGCHMFGICMGSFLYADDLVLLAPSVEALQEMITICCREFSNIDLVLNESKSRCIRIGKRWHEQCVPLRTSKGIIPWSKLVTYLGVNILAAKKFSCCFDKPKSSFYSCFNSIYSKLGKINNPIVTLNLISSVALPCLLFAVEALPLTKAVIKVLEHPWSRVFMKLFWTFNNEIIAQCQLYTGFTTVEHLARERKTKFVSFMHICPCPLIRTLIEILNTHNTANWSCA